MTHHRVGALRRLTLAASVAVMSLVAVGCGPSGTDILDESVATTLALPGVELTLRGSTAVAGGVGAGSFVAGGVAAFPNDAHELHVETQPAGADPTSTDVVTIAGDTFQRGLPGFAPAVWVRVDGAPSAISADLPTFVDPAELLGLLGGLVGDVADEGEESLDQVPTRHYRVVLPPARIQRHIEAAIDAVSPELIAEIAAVGEIQASATADVWIDAEGVVRQLRLITSAGVGDAQAIPGVGAIDNELILSLTPLPTGPDVESPSGPETVRTTFADLFRG